MSEFKKRFQIKRILAAFLAVIMVVTMVPPSAVYAAQDTNLESTADSEDIQSIDTAVDTDTNDVLSPEEAESTETEDFEAPDAAEPSDAAPVGVVDGAGEPAAQADTAAPEIVILPNRTAEYTGSNPFNDLDKYIQVKTGDKESDFSTERDKGTFIAKWQDSANADLTSDPVNKGTYKLVITAGSGAPAGTKVPDQPVEFTITPAKVKLTIKPLTVKAGLPKADIAKEVPEIKVSEAPSAQKVYTDNSIEDDITLTIDAASLANGIDSSKAVPDKLSVSDEYVVTVTANLAYTGTDTGHKTLVENFELDPKTMKVNVRVEDLLATDVTVTEKGDKWYTEDPEDENSARILKIMTYGDTTPALKTLFPNGQIPAASKDNEYFTLGVQEAENPANKVTPADSELTGEWGYYDKNNNWKKSDDVPSDAGIYTYKVTYAGDGAVYDKGVTDIKIEIAQQEILVEPKAATDAVFMDYMTLEDVLAQIDYTAYPSGDSSKKSVIGSEEDKQHFWGTSYNDSGASQPYVPAWTLQKKVGDGAWTEVMPGQRLIKAEGTQYQIVFSGYKAVYNADGSYSDKIDVNMQDRPLKANGNYFVNVDESKKLVLNITDIKDGSPVTIDTSAIPNAYEDINEAIKNARPYVQDKETGPVPYMKSRDEYKKASLKNATGSPVTGEPQTEFTYKWYVSAAEIYRYDGGTYISRYADAADIEAWQSTESGKARLQNSWVSADAEMTQDNILSEAGIYKLVITYKDTERRYYASKSAEVYYVIKPQQVKVVPVPASGYNVFSKTNREQFFEKYEDTLGYQIYALNADGSNGDLLVEKTARDNAGNSEYWKITGTCVSGTGETATTKPIDWVTSFESDTETDKYTYELEANTIAPLVTRNFVSYKSEVKDKETPADTTDPAGTAAPAVKEKERVTTSLNQAASIEVRPMGAQTFDVVPHADKIVDADKTRVYDGKPLDISASLKNGLVTIESEPGKALDGFSYEDLTFEFYKTEGNGYSQDEDDYYSYDRYYTPEETIDAGIYDVYVSYFPKEDEKTYRSFPRTKLEGIQFTVTKRDWVIDASEAVSTITAGRQASGILSDNYSGFDRTMLKMENVVDRDKSDLSDFLQDEDGYNNRWDYPYSYCKADFSIYSNGKPVDGSISSAVSDYELHYNGTLAGRHANNYNEPTLKNAPIIFTVKKGLATFEPTSVKNDKNDIIVYTVTASPSTEETATGYKYTQDITDGIRYTTYQDDKLKLNLEGNLVAVTITAPYEFADLTTAIYKTQIEENGGHIISEKGTTITAIFEVTEETKSQSFKISWRDGYIDEFVLNYENAVLLPNLEDAVEPKALAFKNPVKKMVVGQQEQLDVKITKKQINDIICLDYKSLTEDILAIDENGHVTALKEGTGTVEVYPVHLVNGEKERFSTWTKAVTLKIKVNKVDAPKISSVKALDKNVTVKYSSMSMNQGYRREIYVMQEAKATVKDFEDAILAMENNQYKGKWDNSGWKGVFAVAPVYYNSTEEWNIRNSFGYDMPTATISGLKPFTDYTVYVRNVSGIRTLNDDSSKVMFSCNGTVKSFKTTRVQVKNLINRHSVTDEVYQNGDIQIFDTPRFTTTNGSELRRDWEQIGNYWHVQRYVTDLTVGTVKVAVKGEFEISDSSDEQKAEYAETGDTVWVDLPLTKENQKLYENPKLTYAVWDAAKGKYVQKTDLISIDKKGTVKFKGIGDFRIRIKDENTCECYKSSNSTRIWDCDDYESCSDHGAECNKCVYLTLRVEAGISSIAPKAKTTKLEVGQSVPLKDLIVFKNNSNKIIKGFGDCEDVAENILAQIPEAQRDSFELVGEGEGLALRALKPNASLNLPVSYNGKESNSRMSETLSSPLTTQVAVTSTVLSPVKAFKVIDVIDKSLVITFQEHPYADGYRIELRDSRHMTGNTVIKYIDPSSNSHDGTGLRWVEGKDGKYYCYYKITGLTQQSQYKVGVKAVFRDEASKLLTKTAKTTKIPAYGTYWGDVFGDFDEDDMEGGATLYISRKGDQMVRLNRYSNDAYYNRLLSGNIYTLTAQISDSRARLTDTLTWTSTNKKAATVKAGGGSFSAALTAVGAGSTFIEVRSKIWKRKVIARWRVTVLPVGDAYKADRFFGQDDENTPAQPGGSGDSLAPNVPSLPIDLGGARKVLTGDNQYSGRSFTFTAPETAKYVFKSDTEGVNVYLGTSIPVNDSLYETVDYNIGWLEKGKTVTLYTYGKKQSGLANKDITAYYVYVEQDETLSALNAGAPVTVNSNDAPVFFTFTADTEGWYSFYAPISAEAGAESCTITLYDKVSNIEENSFENGNGVQCYLEAGKQIYGRISNVPTTTTLVVEKATPVALAADGTASTAQPVQPGRSTYLSYAIPVAGKYTFTLSSDSADISAELFRDSVPLGSYNSGGPVDITESCIVYLKLSNSHASETAVVKVDTAQLEKYEYTALVAATDVPVTLNADGVDRRSFTAGTAGNYKFSWNSAEAVTGRLYLNLEDLLSSSVGREIAQITLQSQTAEDGTVRYSGSIIYAMEAGQTIYVVTNGTGSANVTERVEPAGMDDKIKTLSVGNKLDSLENGDWICFTAPEDGIYQIDNNDVSLYASCTYTTVAPSGNSSKVNNLRQLPMDKGEAIWLYVSSAYTSSTVQAILRDKVTDITANPARKIDTGAEDVWFSYTLPADADYRFFFENENGIINSLAMYSRSEGEHILRYGSYTPVKGLKIYVSLNNRSGRLYVERYVETTPDVHSGYTKKIGTVSVNAGQYQWIRFTAPSKGTYRFYSTDRSGDPKAWFYTDMSIGDNASLDRLNDSQWESRLGEDDDDGGNNNFSYSQPLAPGETIYIAVGHYSLTSSVSCTVYVELE